MAELFRENWPHVAVSAALVFLQFFSRDLWTLYYRHIRRDSLIHAGAKSCSGYAPALADEALQPCDLVIRNSSASETIEIFYSPDGRAEKTLRSVNGQFVNSSVNYPANKAMFILPSLAFTVGLVALLHKIARTRAFFTWQLARYPWDAFEKLLLLYALPVFVLSIFLPAVRR